MGLLDDAYTYWGDKAKILAGLLQAGAESGASAYAGATKPYTKEQAKTIGGLLADFTPVVGGVKGAIEEAHAGNPGWAAFNAATVPLDVATLGGASAIKGGLLKAIPALAAHTVWHGSPHKFDKFDMSKIGTGEGAQAYGHGIYLAESPRVADSYRANLSDNVFKVGDKELLGPSTRYAQQSVNPSRAELSMPEKIATYALDSAVKSGSKDPAADAIKHLTKKGKGNVDVPAALELINQWKSQGANLEAGQLYKVDIPDEAVARFLDWDKPLSQQHEGVRVAVQDLGLPANATGKDAYNALANLARDGAIARGNNAATTLSGSQSAASVDLQGYGIPGIRYLDGGSRGAGNGTSNFVLFSDDLARILERNGQATGQVPWKPGEWRGLLGGQ